MDEWGAPPPPLTFVLTQRLGEGPEVDTAPPPFCSGQDWEAYSCAVTESCGNYNSLVSQSVAAVAAAASTPTNDAETTTTLSRARARATSHLVRQHAVAENDGTAKLNIKDVTLESCDTDVKLLASTPPSFALSDLATVLAAPEMIQLKLVDTGTAPPIIGGSSSVYFRDGDAASSTAAVEIGDTAAATAKGAPAASSAEAATVTPSASVALKADGIPLAATPIDAAEHCVHVTDSPPPIPPTSDHHPTHSALLLTEDDSHALLSDGGLLAALEAHTAERAALTAHFDQQRAANVAEFAALQAEQERLSHAAAAEEAHRERQCAAAEAAAGQRQYRTRAATTVQSLFRSLFTSRKTAAAKLQRERERQAAEERARRAAEETTERDAAAALAAAVEAFRATRDAADRRLQLEERRFAAEQAARLREAEQAAAAAAATRLRMELAEEDARRRRRREVEEAEAAAAALVAEEEARQQQERDELAAAALELQAVQAHVVLASAAHALRTSNTARRLQRWYARYAAARASAASVAHAVITFQSAWRGRRVRQDPAFDFRAHARRRRLKEEEEEALLLLQQQKQHDARLLEEAAAAARRQQQQVQQRLEWEAANGWRVVPLQAHWRGRRLRRILRRAIQRARYVDAEDDAVAPLHAGDAGGGEWEEGAFMRDVGMLFTRVQRLLSDCEGEGELRTTLTSSSGRSSGAGRSYNDRLANTLPTCGPAVREGADAIASLAGGATTTTSGPTAAASYPTPTICNGEGMQQHPSQTDWCGRGDHKGSIIPSQLAPAPLPPQAAVAGAPRPTSDGGWGITDPQTRALMALRAKRMTAGGRHGGAGRRGR